MKNLSIIIFLLLCSNLLSAQTVIKGVIKNEKNEVVQMSNVKVEGTQKWVQGNSNGEFKISLDKGKHTLLFGGVMENYFPKKIEVEISDQTTIQLDVKLESLTREKVLARVKKTGVSDELMGDWKLICMHPTGAKKTKFKKVGMRLTIGKNAEGLGMLRLWDECRGTRWQSFFSMGNDELMIHSDFELLIQTTEIRPCDTKFAKRRKAVLGAFYELEDLAEVEFTLKKNWMILKFGNVVWSFKSE